MNSSGIFPEFSQSHLLLTKSEKQKTKKNKQKKTAKKTWKWFVMIESLSVET